MSKKTKKQKLLADRHRQKNPSVEKNLPSIADGVPSVKTDQSASLYSYPIQLIRKDLTKTLILCILAISLELALFLILEKKVSLPFKVSF